jgi:outer membrane lipoprotein carrier protein LolA
MRGFVLLCALALGPSLCAADPDSLAVPAHRLKIDDPAWRDLAVQVGQRPDAVADFEEHRWFPFKKLPTVLKGEVRVSASHGLSLHYVEPQDRTVIIDERGLLLREGGHDSTPPPDPRGAAANTAMLDLLRFDLAALARTFEIYGERKEEAWTLALVPQADALRHTLGQITVAGEKLVVRRIELRRSVTQRVEILVGPARPPAAFTAEELRRFFR